MTTIRQKTIAGLKVGDRFCVQRTFTAEDVAAFARLSRDDNPVHSSGKWVEAKGFDGKICHGLLVASLLTEVGGQIGWLASRMDFRFKRPVYIGDSVECAFAITDIAPNRWAEAEAQMTNQVGEGVIEARIWGILPDEREREILKALSDQSES